MDSTRRRIPHILVILLLVAGTMVALATTVRTKMSEIAGVTRSLPVDVAAYQGVDILYCHNRDLHGVMCKQFEGDVNALTHCDDPACGQALFTMDIGEKIALPASTDIYKKRYHKPGSPHLTTTVVLSGDDRASFHRPKVCINAQGHRIQQSRIIEVELPDREPLRVMVYDLLLSLEGSQEVSSYFAFWYVGKDRETASHYERMFWMGYDRMIRNVAHRWAYVSITGPREPENDDHIQQLETFLAELYPQVRLAE